jgi:flagellar hook-basal body complex protein FliE
LPVNINDSTDEFERDVERDVEKVDEIEDIDELVDKYNNFKNKKEINRSSSQPQIRDSFKNNIRGEIDSFKDTRISAAAYSEAFKTTENKEKITVPVPFRFEQRDATRGTSIRKRRMEEMINDLQREEDELIN